MSSGDTEEIRATVECMRVIHLRMLMYDLRCMWSDEYSQDNVNMESTRSIIDNEAAINGKV